jgi:CHAT domain-containing protein/tetratricopeptide (TPR) repeat protein
MNQQLKATVELIDLLWTCPDDSQQIILKKRMAVLNDDLLVLLPEVFAFMGESEDTANQFSNLATHLLEFSLGSIVINVEIAIKCCQLALNIYTKADFTQEWARTQINLAVAYQYRIKGNKSDNIEQAIKFYKLALNIYTENNFPQSWAIIQTNLAKIHRESEFQNVDLSIGFYKLAFNVFTQTDYPEEWAENHKQLGDIYSDLDGESIELSIQHYHLSLEVYTRVDFPGEWAFINSNLGFSYHARVIGSRSDNIKLAIKHWNLALAIYIKSVSPIHWALNHMNLGGAYIHHKNDKIDNIELSINSSSLATEVFTETYFPKEWADAHTNLAVAYLNKRNGNIIDNLRLSVKHSQLALRIFTKEDYPNQYHKIYTSIMSAYEVTIKLFIDIDNDIEIHINELEIFLEIFTEDVFPWGWANTHLNLAISYAERSIGKVNDNLEISLQHYQQSLKIFTEVCHPLDWATTHMCLAANYRRRIKGDKENNVELSISSCLLALKYFNKNPFSEDWAVTHMNLANSYKERVIGNNAENIELSIEHHNLALTVLNQDAYPICWAATCMNLANSYKDRIIGDKLTNLMSSITYHSLALAIFTEVNYPERFAKTKMNLANIYLDMSNIGVDNIELSINCYKSALLIFTEDKFPYDWAFTNSNLASAYRQRLEGDKKQNIKLAILCYDSALKIRTEKVLPRECLNTAQNLGNLHFTQNNWLAAINAYNTAINAIENLRTETNVDHKQSILDENISIYENLIQAAINTDQLAIAITTIERIRSKRLIELMATPYLYQDNNVPTEILTLLIHIDNLHNKINQIRTENHSSDNNTTKSLNRNHVQQTSTEIFALQQQLHQALSKLADKDPVAAGFSQVPAITLKQLQQLVTPNSALLSFYTTKNNTIIFILRYNNPPQLFTCKGQGYDNLQTWLQTNWLQEYAISKNHKNDKDEKDYEPWKSNIPVKLAELSQRLQLPELIEQHLQDIQSLIIIPHLALHYMPFAALPLSDGTRLGDKFQISHAPAAQVLKYCVDRDPLNSQQYGIIENATNDLKKTPGECQTVAILNKVPIDRHLVGKPQATINNYRKLLNQCNNILSSHHATADLNNPLESSLLLGDGRISVGQLISPGWRFKNLDEVFMSCCETSLGNQTNLADELLTISTGYLCAGARGVIGTLWSVSDQATALFSSIYHYYRHQGIPRAAALQQTQNNFCSTTKTPACAAALKTLFDEQKIQAQSQQNLARTLRDQYPADSSEYQEQQRIIDRHAEQAQSFYGMKQDIEKLGTRKNPYTSEFYWAAFTCNGIG